MRKFHTEVHTILRAVIVLLGLWALYAQVCVLAGASYTTLRFFSFLPLLIAVGVLWGLSRVARPLDVSVSFTSRMPGWPFRWRWIRIGGPFVISALYAITKFDLLVWFLATIYLSAEVWFGQPNVAESNVSDSPASRLEVGGLIGLCVLAALLTSGTNRPDADDAYFLSVAVATTDFPDAALQSFDALHRSGLPPVEQALHLPQVYEILIGLLSDISGLSVHTLYYVVLPPLWAALGVLANWLVLRHFLSSRDATWGTVIYFLILVFWGDGHPTFGNFGFVRLFQGKAIYLTVVLPLIVHTALRYRERPGFATWFSLVLSQCAATGLTTNGIVVAPLAAALCIVARPRFDFRFVWTMLIGVAASLPTIIVSMAMYLKMVPYLSAVSIDGRLLSYTTTLGKVRTPLVLLGLIFLPVLAAKARVKCANWIAGYIWIVVLIIFMPVVWVLAAAVLGNVFSWRLFWAVPVPLLLSLAGAIAVSAIGARRWLVVSAFAAWIFAFVFGGSAAVSSHLFSFENIGQPKVIDAPFAVAKEIIALARPDAPALVPEGIAVYITGFPNPPPLVGVRNLYLKKLQGFVPDDQLASQVALFSYVANAKAVMSVSTALAELEARGIATVVFHKTHRDASALTSSLTEYGFAVYPVDDFVIVARPK